MESFNSILERAVIRRFEFESFQEAESTIERFADFYNYVRLHSAMEKAASREMNRNSWGGFRKLEILLYSTVN
jgi:putative transposase